MAEPFIKLALQGIGPLTDNYDNIKERAKKLPIRRRKSRRNQQSQDDAGYDSYDEPRRRDVRDGDYSRGSDQRRRRTQPDPRYDDYRNGDGRRQARRYDAPRDDRRRYYRSDDEPSPPRYRPRGKSVGAYGAAPYAVGGAAGGAAAASSFRDRSRDGNRQQLARRNRSPDGNRQQLVRQDRSADGNNQQHARRDRRQSEAARSESEDSDGRSSSSSDVSVGSSEDERRARKLKYGIPLTAGIAAVATIHAANSIYKSKAAHDKRVEQVRHGEITPEEAKKLQRKGYLNDAAKIGLSALSLQAVKGKWTEVEENRKQYQNHKQERRRRHEKRVQKADKARSRNAETPDGRDRDMRGQPRSRRPDLTRRRSSF